MATLDDSPSVYSGQSWSIWAEKVPLAEDGDPEEEDVSSRSISENNSMKLRKEDLPLFGYCPAQDELYLVVCEKCEQVIKPQALKTHLEKRHGSKDSAHLSASSRSHSSSAKGGHCGGYLSHRTSSHMLSSKVSGKQTSNMATSASPLKVSSSYSNDLKMASVEVSLKRLSPDVKTLSLHSDPVKSQLSPKTSSVSNLTANSVSNGTVKSTTNGAMTSVDSSPPPTVPLYCASLTNSLSPLHNAAHKSLSLSPFSSQASSSLNKDTPGAGPPSSPNSLCSSPIERNSEKSTSIKNPMTVSPTKSPSSSSKNSSVSKASLGKTKSSQSITKTSSNSSNKVSSSSKNSTSPLKCSTSPVKSSTSPARSAPSPAKSAPSPAKSAPSPAKSAPSPAKSPSKSSSSPSQSSAGSTPIKTTKAPKERKFVLCRDREFDPNIHCGVLRSDDGRHCTRSLTCKTHALSLRRAVEGRRKKFDDLLKEHRAAKEAQLKAKSEGKAAAVAGMAALGSGALSPLSLVTDNSLPGSKLGRGADVNLSYSDEAPLLGSHKLSSPQSNNTTKFNKQTLKPLNTNHPRLSSSGLQSPSWLMEDMSPPDIVSRLSSDGEVDTEETEDRGDNSYVTHHPIPIATCTFGGRCSTGGWYLFSRKTDYLRSAFLSALEKHLHPPPHKKLCVESKLPKEPQLSTNSMDPYEFNIVDMNASNLASHNAMLNSVHKSAVNKTKSKPQNSRTSKSKGDNTSPRLSQSGASNNPSPTGPGVGIKRKRSSSGASSPGSAASSVTSVSLQNTMIGGLSLATPNTSPIIAACVPNMNLNSNALSRFSSSVSTGKSGQMTKNNIIKDGGLNLLVTSMDQSMVNGQYVNITGNMLEKAASQVGVPLEEKGGNSKRNRSGGGNPKQNTSKQVGSSVEGLCSISNNIMANITQKAIIVDKSMLAPTAVSPFQTSSVLPIANSAMSPPQASPSATPSPFFRSGSISPQVSAASPIPNGVISPPAVSLKAYPFTALNHMTGHKTASPPASRTSTPSPSPNFSAHESPPSHSTHFAFIGKSHANSGSHRSHKSNSSHRSGSHPPSLSAAVTLGAGQPGAAIQQNHANSIHNFCVTNTPTAMSGLGSLPLKPSGVKTFPLTMPFTVASSVSHSLTGQQQPTATLFVTSENMSKGELQLQQASTTHSNVIS